MCSTPVEADASLSALLDAYLAADPVAQDAIARILRTKSRLSELLVAFDEGNASARGVLLEIMRKPWLYQLQVLAPDLTEAGLAEDVVMTMIEFLLAKKIGNFDPSRRSPWSHLKFIMWKAADQVRKDHPPLFFEVGADQAKNLASCQFPRLKSGTMPDQATTESPREGLTAEEVTADPTVDVEATVLNTLEVESFLALTADAATEDVYMAWTLVHDAGFYRTEAAEEVGISRFALLRATKSLVQQHLALWAA